MFEIKLYLYLRYWTLFPRFYRTDANGMVLTDVVWLCFGIGYHWPVEDVEQDETEEDAA